MSTPLRRLVATAFLLGAAGSAQAASLSWPGATGACAGTLQACVDAAASGDSILIGPEPGSPDSYTAINETLDIRKSLTLEARPGIDAVFAHGRSIAVNTLGEAGPASVTLRRLVFRNGAYANRFHLWIMIEQPAAALRDVEMAERIWSEQVPPGHEWLLNTASQRGLAMARMGQLDEGARLIDGVVLARKKARSPRIAPALAMRAEVSRRMGKLDIALAEAREAVRLQRSIADHEPLLLPMRIVLADILAESGDAAAATRELASVEKTLRNEGFSPFHPRLVQMHRTKAVLASASGDAEGARRESAEADRLLAMACDAACVEEAGNIAAGR